MERHREGNSAGRIPQMGSSELSNAPQIQRPGQRPPSRQVQPLSVDEALQYTPFSSIVPIGSDPTPPTPGLRSVKAKSPSKPKPTASTISKRDHNDQIHSQNSAATLQKAQHTPVKSLTSTPMVVIPAPSNAFPYKDYETVPDAATSITAPNLEEAQDIDATTFDQKAKSDASLQALQELLNDIFEAEDQLQPDTSGLVSTDASRIFVSGTFDQGDTPALSSSTQSKLEKSLVKVISGGRFSEVPSDVLLRIEKLCEGALRPAEGIDIKIPDLMSENDLDHWMERISVVDNGLKSAKILLRIMTGGRQEKQLYAEELMQSILSTLKNALDSCIIPVVELRSAGGGSDTFKAITSQKKSIIALVNQSSRVLQLLANLIVKEEVSDGAVTTVEFVSSGLIFVENAHNEKESVLGVQWFERLRVAAMDSLAKIFSKYPDQRSFIFDEILTSLERLPVSRQSARQFRLIEGNNIQLVSALIMRLIQASAAYVELAETMKSKRTLRISEHVTDDQSDSDSGEGEAEDAVGKGRAGQTRKQEARTDQSVNESLGELKDAAQPLLDSAQKNAHYVTQFLVSRALKSTKTGDDPYRVLLDIFVEDFISALPSTDWPASELLLRSLLTSMVGIAEGERSNAPAKVMALDHLAMMGSSICELRLKIQQSFEGMEIGSTGLDTYFEHVTNSFLTGNAVEADLVVWDGAYRTTIEYLQERDLNDPQIQSARAYLTTVWASRLVTVLEAADLDQYNTESEDGPAQVASRLKMMVLDQKWLEAESDFEAVSTSQGRLAYALTVMKLPFGKAFERILMILVDSSNSDQATVRSKSLKSVVQLLEKDPSILEREKFLVQLISKKASDGSPLVRDSALGLIGKCLSLQPTLEEDLWEPIRQRTLDTVVGVRKRAMKIIKDIYLRNTKQEVRSAMADALLHRMKDTDETVCELARQTFEEIWISPFYASAGTEKETVQDRLALKDQSSLIIRTTQRHDNVASVLDSLLQSLLSDSSKNMTLNFRVCKRMVSLMFDDVIDEEDKPGKPSRQQILQTLTVFAKANADLFTAEQLELLQPYVEHLSKNDDLSIYRCIVVIYRCVLPSIKNVKESFLAAIQKALLGSITILVKRELNEVIACLWTINGMLKNLERLSRVTISCMKAIHAARNEDLNRPDKSALLSRIIRFLTIAGLFGKYCDFGTDLFLFKRELPWWKGDSVPGSMISVFAPFTNPKQPIMVRRAALESLGLICQSWPKYFLNEQVCTAFELVFDERQRDLEHLVLTGFKDFLALEEVRSGNVADGPDGGENALGAGRLGGAIAANQEDGVTASIAQRYLQQAIRIGLASQDTYAVTAVEVIAAISRQGLVHPKECGPVLVALETSQNPTIASMAFREHRTLHQKHETIVEKEYMRAVRQAFEYQRDVVGDIRGATMRPFCSKLHSLFDVIKISKGKVRKKFLTNLCKKIDFDTSKLDISEIVPAHVLYARFLIENLAFFDYNSIDELAHAVSCMERVVSSTGTSIAHGIESEILKVSLEHPQVTDEQAILQSAPAAFPIDEHRLKQLTSASMILSILWNTRSHLRRLYGLNKEVKPKDNKTKPPTKELKRAPVRTAGVTGDRLWEQINLTMSALNNSGAMTTQCQKFVELLSIDHELKVAIDDDEEEDQPMANLGAQTPSEEEPDGLNGTLNGSAKGRKRKNASETPGSRGEKRRRPSSSKAKKSAESEDDESFFG
ncbi:MAG: hypothetical protein M4579_004021 [Chaenotheca gracillima]|nr:MAG: hypothetical protein M4579_004021 [Chaenotheca gracillima]